MSAIEKAVETYIKLRADIQHLDTNIQTLENDYRGILKNENIGGEFSVAGAEKVYKAYKEIQNRKQQNEKDKESLKEEEEIIIDYLKALDGNRLVYSYLKKHQIQNTIFSFYLNEGALECDPPIDA